MVQPRPFFAWLLLSLVTCLLALNLTSPGLLQGVFRPHKSLELVPSKRAELPKSAAIARVSPREGTDYLRCSGEITGIPPLTLGEVRAMKAAVAGQRGPVVACAYNDEPPDGRDDQPRSYPKTEAVFLPSPESPRSVAAEGQSGAQIAEGPQQPKGMESEMGPPTTPPEMVRRLPTVVANIPGPIHSAPQAGVQPSAADFRPNPGPPQPPTRISESDRQRAERRADDSWREPETLLESLNGLTAAGPVRQWAAEVIRQIRALGPAVAGGSDESVSILERLADLNRQATQLAETMSDKPLARKLLKTNFALRCRLDVWQEVVRLGVPQMIDTASAVANPQNLAICLAKIDWLTRESAEGQAWRQYLLVDALKESSRRPPSAQDHTTQQLAQRVLERLTETPLTPHQHQFVSSGPVAVLREELRHWAAEPVGATAVLRDIETFERTTLPSDARRLALDFQHLAVSPIDGRRRLADRVNWHYRNANCRIAVTEELLNKLIPAQRGVRPRGRYGVGAAGAGRKPDGD